jgi:hypothetical protein
MRVKAACLRLVVASESRAYQSLTSIHLILQPGVNMRFDSLETWPESSRRIK